MTELPLIAAEQTAGACACCSTPAIESTPRKDAAMSTETITTVYTVTGMTCGHCVTSVTEEIGAIDTVTGVQVDLATGRVTVTSTAALELEAVKAAVDEAGYALAS